ncbi:MAG: TonB-dependent receptor, partial [bacterium]|nr:TonB-dependent receptor [bacterium]
TEYNVEDDVFTQRQNNAVQSVNALGKWQTTWGEGRHITLQESAFWKSQGIPGISNNQSQRAHLSNLRLLTEMILEDRELLTGYTIRHTVYFTHTGESFLDTDGEVGIGRQDNTYQTRTMGWQGRVQKISRNPITVSAGILREAYHPDAHLQTTPDLFDSQRWTFSGRAGADWALPFVPGVLSVGLDVRHQRSSFTGANPFSFSPLAPDSANTRLLMGIRSGLRVDILENLIFKANLGRTLRAPSFYELFGDRGGVVGNVNLKPERGLTWDAGVRYGTEAAVLEGVFFDHRYRDLIQFAHTSQATSRPVNIGRARAWGVEVTAQKTIWGPFGVSGNYTFQRATDQSDVPHLRGNTLPNRPAHSLFARVTGGLGRVTAFYDYAFEDGNFLDQANRRPLASRHIHNAGMKIRVGKGVQAGLEVKNLGNAQVADTWGYPLPGRAMFVNLQEQF